MIVTCCSTSDRFSGAKKRLPAKKLKISTLSTRMKNGIIVG